MHSIPASSSALRISGSVLDSSWCSMSACHSPMPLKPAFAASAQRSAKGKRLHSRPTCTTTGPAEVQYAFASSTFTPAPSGRKVR